MQRTRLRRRLVPLRDDSGFTLIEAAAAMAIAVIFFIGFATTMGSSLRGSRDNYLHQTATAIAMDHLEFSRSLLWVEVAMSDIDGSAPMLNGGGDALDATEAGLTADELLVEDTTDGLVSPKQVETVDNDVFTVWRYVTDGPGDLRRVVVLVTWAFDDVARSFQVDTLIGEVSAG